MEKYYSDFLLSLYNTPNFRQLPKPWNQVNILNFANNDYLQLSKHPKVIEEVKNGLADLGCGATGSRLLSGNYKLIEEFEARIALDKNTEDALVFPSGFQANYSVLSALLDPKVLQSNPLVFFDKLNHASLYHALKAHNLTPIRYRHLDLEHLSTLLEKYRFTSAPKFIISETLFGMDGDKVDLITLIKMAKNHNAFLYLDEAHATGLLGPKGYGLSTCHDLSEVPHLVMGSFSKAIGSQGGYIACSKTIKNYIINHCQGFIYSTACSPLLILAAYAAWKLLPELQNTRVHILQLSNLFHQALKLKNLEIHGANSHIQPILVDNSEVALKRQQWFLKQGFWCSAIRPPTVPTARLRFAFNSSITEKHLKLLLEVLEQW